MNEHQETEVVFCGLREMRNHKLGVVLAPLALVEKGDLETCGSVFEWKVKDRPRVVGAIYKVPVLIDEKGLISSVKGKLNATGEKISDEAAAFFESRHKSAQVSNRARKLEDAMRKDSSLEKILNPLRAKLFSLDSYGRLALEVVILNELRRPRR